ncbi:MAG: hypothetical protein AAFN78_11640 [Pseudomonadota bacterium]
MKLQTVASVVALTLVGFQANAATPEGASVAAEFDVLVADNPRKDRRDGRQDRRPDRRDDRQDCRDSEGLAGNDKRDCKQDQRGDKDAVEADDDKSA